MNQFLCNPWSGKKKLHSQRGFLNCNEQNFVSSCCRNRKLLLAYWWFLSQLLPTAFWHTLVQIRPQQFRTVFFFLKWLFHEWIPTNQFWPRDRQTVYPITKSCPKPLHPFTCIPMSSRTDGQTDRWTCESRPTDLSNISSGTIKPNFQPSSTASAVIGWPNTGRHRLIIT